MPYISPLSFLPDVYSAQLLFLNSCKTALVGAALSGLIVMHKLTCWSVTEKWNDVDCRMMKNPASQTTSKLLPDANNVKDDWTSWSRTSSKSNARDEHADVRYGCCRSHPTWLQPLNNIVGFIVFVSLANCMQSLANGLLGVVLSTIERHFHLSSSASSWIASSYEIGQIPVLVVVSLLGTRSAT